jgi:peptide chain release factor 1
MPSSSPSSTRIAEWRGLKAELAEAEALAADPEMRALAEEEITRLTAAIPEAEHALQLALLPKDEADARPAMLEIRPGTGGEEAALFAGDLLRMYTRYAEAKGWRSRSSTGRRPSLAASRRSRRGSWARASSRG